MSEKTAAIKKCEYSPLAVLTVSCSSKKIHFPDQHKTQQMCEKYFKKVLEWQNLFLVTTKLKKMYKKPTDYYSHEYYIII